LGWLNDAVNVLQLISLPILIVVTLYGAFSAYLTDFWRGFMLGALVVFLPMLILNIYLTRRHGRDSPTAMAMTKLPERELPSGTSPTMVTETKLEPIQAPTEQPKAILPYEDPIPIAQDWVAGRLKQVGLRSIQSSPSEDNKDGTIEVTGIAQDNGGMMHFFRVRMTKQRKILVDRSELM
jgi:hypothetical protein